MVQCCRVAMLQSCKVAKLQCYNVAMFIWWPFIFTATAQLMLNRKYYEIFKPKMEFNMRNIMYIALCMHMHKEKTTFLRKDIYIWEWGQGTKSPELCDRDTIIEQLILNWWSTQGAKNIPLCGIFPTLYWIFSNQPIRDSVTDLCYTSST